MRASSTAESLTSRCEFGPGHERQVRLLERIRCPAETEQRLVRLHAVQAHSLQVGACAFVAVLLQCGETERDVGLVAKAADFFVLGRCTAEFVEHGGAARAVAPLDECPPEVEGRGLACGLAGGVS